MVRRRAATNELPPSLPPRELRKPRFVNPEQIIETPLTPIGLVDRKKLVRLVNATLNSAYKWPSARDDEHHLLWPNAWYPDLADEKVNPHVFRNRTINRADLPVGFHRWLHKVTIPPPPPSLDTMAHVEQAQDGIDDMASAVRIGMQLMRNRQVTVPRLNGRMDQLLEQYQEGLTTIKKLPPEFHFIDPDVYTVASVEDMLMIRGELGRLATKPTVATTTRFIRQETIAA